jgi:radical SAM protein with 4Fe4S-binding SPASM domain
VKPDPKIHIKKEKMDQKVNNQDFINHLEYGNLKYLDSVVISTKDSGKLYPIENMPLCIHLTITMKCNAKCRGCINSSITFKEPFSIESNSSDTIPKRDSAAIVSLIQKDNTDDVVVCFYGGEPFLAPDKISEVISFLEKKIRITFLRFMVYTNGIGIKDALLSYPEIGDKIWLYSISIDGTEKQHDAIRRGAPLWKIRQNLSFLKENTFLVNVLMWSTLREGQSVFDCFEEFLSLHNKGLVDHFFWHFIETDGPFVNFSSFAGKYEYDLRKILNIYINYLKKGKVLSIIHLNELILYIITGRSRGSSACGVELSRNYDIIGGKIQTCADLPSDYSLGVINIDGSFCIKDRDLSHLIGYKEVLGCNKCGIHSYCGGRCPVQALTGNQIRVKQYCQLMRLHVAVVLDFIKEIKILLDDKGISLQDIYNRSAFYTQFTDVTP